MTRLYHGTKTTAAAEKIMREGLVAQDDAIMGRKPRGALTPIQGHVYLTPSIKYACIYALGGNMVGMSYYDEKNLTPARREEMNANPYGYIFVVDTDVLTLIPDEYEVGHAVREAPAILAHYTKNTGTIMNSRHMDNLAFGQALNDTPSVARELSSLANQYLTPLQKDKIWRGYDYDIMAQVGKKLIPRMSRALMDRMIAMGCHVSTPDSIMPQQCWRFNKQHDNPHLGFQAENFFEVAERIR